MKILKQHKGKDAKIAKYDRSDMEPIEGAVDEVKWYILEETERTPVNQFEIIDTTYQLTDQLNAEYPHFFRAIEVHTVSQISNEAIIQRMNDSIGMHLDQNYPIYKRVRHERELRQGTTPERTTYIQSLVDWEMGCLASRDQKENELINNNQLPVFDWEPVPQN